MSTALRFLLPLALLALFTAAEPAPEIVVRFFGEAKAMDTERFAQPVQLMHPPRAAYLERVPVLSERNIKYIYPFTAVDGSWGCLFKLDESGRINLEVASTERRGSSLVAYVGTKKAPRQVIDMAVDKPVRDGIITIPRGLTLEEIALLKKKFKPVPPKPAATPAPEAPKMPTQTGY